MAHSRIFELSKAPLERREWAVADDIAGSGFVGDVADYTRDLNEVERQESIEALRALGEGAFDIVQEGQFLKLALRPQGRERYFADRFNALASLVSSLTIDGFCNSATAWKMQELIEQKRTFYVSEDGWYQTLDSFMRTWSVGEEYYIGAAIDYHM